MFGNGVARRMLHRPMLIWQCPSLATIDGIKVDLSERQNAEFYFMEKGHEPIFPQLENLQGGQRPPVVGTLSNSSENVLNDTGSYPRSWPGKNQIQNKNQFSPAHFRGSANYNSKP
jgi:hypothetical protein